MDGNKYVIKSMLAIERSNKEEEAATGAAVRQRQKRDKAGLVKMSTNITDQLLPIMSVQGTQDELLSTSSTISQSGKLLAKYGRREFTDKLLLFFAFVFFIASTLVAVVLVCTCDGAASPFLYGLYPVAPQNRRRSWTQKPYRERSGRGRYNEICRLHADDSIAFPGRIGNPVCPW
ncbi:Secretory 20 [Carabus blaptoides fortunei]